MLHLVLQIPHNNEEPMVSYFLWISLFHCYVLINAIEGSTYYRSNMFPLYNSSICKQKIQYNLFSLSPKTLRFNLVFAIGAPMGQDRRIRPLCHSSVSQIQPKTAFPLVLGLQIYTILRIPQIAYQRIVNEERRLPWCSLSGVVKLSRTVKRSWIASALFMSGHLK